MPSRIIIFDDNKQRLKSVSMLINTTTDLVCVSEFLNTSDIIEKIKTTQPDLVLMDIDMPGGDGISATKILRSFYPDLIVIMQTIFDENEKIFASLRARANGYLLKKTLPAKFVESLREALLGEAPMTASIAVKVLSYFSSPRIENKYKLTMREKELLKYLINGHSYKMIAAELNLSFHTVNSHFKNIYDKLYVHSATEAVSLALKEQLI